jgi:hypothetical protein
MRPVLSRLPLASLLLVGVAIVGCPRTTTNVVDAPKLVACEADEQCPTGNLCIAGECRLGTCNPAIEAQCGADVVEGRSPVCCKVFENCNGLTLTCERDPAAVGIGCPPGETDCIPCTENRDCVADLGFSSFCSGGRCFAQDGLTPCSQDFQCATDERCDRTEFFCVKDSGGCRFCGEDFPELCCENGQVCDVESGICVDVGDRECTVETVQDDCRAGQRCDAVGRCVQCIDNGDCGPGTECNPATGLCVGTATRCVESSDCPATLRCINESCGVPQCEGNDDCGDSRERCENFTCVLPTAVCAEDDEPNNTSAQAIALPTVADSYGGKLCRGDTDYLSFPVLPLKRYTVTVTATSTPAAGLAVTLFNTTGGVESSATFAPSPANVSVVGVTAADETGRFELVINSGSNTLRDEWSYTVTIREDQASVEPDCSAAAQAGQEPNNAFDTAVAVVADNVAVPFTRCGTDDVDYFAVSVPALNGVEVTVDGFQNAEGNLNVELFRGPSSTQLADRATTTANSETADAPEGSTTYYVRVFLDSASGVLTNQGYAVRARAVPRPAACDVDVGENDGAVATAAPMTTTTVGGGYSGSHTARRCNPQDVDHVRFEVPANRGGVLRLAFQQSTGDLRLDLLDDAGVQVATANSSSAASGLEAIDIPTAATAVTYVARVQVGSSSPTPLTAQEWTLSLTTYDAAQCLATEPSADGTFATARCIGDFTTNTTCNGARLPLPLQATLAGCAADGTMPGCGRTCGNVDSDFYRLGAMGTGRAVRTALRFDPSAGDLSVQLARMSGSTPTAVGGIRRDSDRDGVIEFEATTSGASAEYVVIVKPEGATGHEAQLYALSVDVSGACLADDNDRSSPGNATPATSTRLRAAPVAGQDDEIVAATLCVGTTSDIDVYELLALSGETITVRAVGLSGLRLRVGRRPVNLNDPAIVISGGEDVAGSDGIASVTFASSTFQTMYLTLDRTSTAAVGAYTLTIDYTLPVDEDDDGVTDDAGDPDDDDACVPDATVDACDADDDGTLNGDDSDDVDPCVPDANAIACASGDADGDGVDNATDAAAADPCLPNANAVACASGDADGDGAANGIDADDADVCVPNANALACASGDADGDGEANGTDADDANVCIPTPDEATCDVDSDGTNNGDDPDDADACVPTDDGTCGAADADGDGTANATDPDDGNRCVPDNTLAGCTP